MLHEGQTNLTYSVAKFVRIPNAGNLKAFASVQLGPVILDGFRVIQQPGQKAWVSVPREKGADGNYYNRVYFEHDGDLDTVRSAVLSAWENYNA